MHIPRLADPANRPAFLESCVSYLGARTGKYEWRAIRYRAALEAMQEYGLSHSDTVYDIGAGWTEFDYCLRTEGHSRCRYIPVDGGIDGTDLAEWMPPHQAEWFVALELVEHLDDPQRLIEVMQQNASKGIILSTPNPETTDVLGMDPTHKVEIHRSFLESLGFEVTPSRFYGQESDSLLAVWYR